MSCAGAAHPRVVVVAPEPVSWLQAVVAACRGAAAGEPVGVGRRPGADSELADSELLVLAPWATPKALTELAPRLPARLADFVARRAIPVVGSVRSAPGWNLATGALRVWAHGHTPRDMWARFAVRRAVDIWVARWLARVPVPPRVLLTPSLAARRTLAVCARRGVRSVLLEDIPSIRQLHGDLDGARVRHPDCAFLTRYRAPDTVLVQQEVEWSLADHLAVRGHYALAARPSADTDVGGARIVAMPAVDARVSDRPPGPRGRRPCALLAGLAAARHGTVEALVALERLPELSLRVRVGEGLEPAGLLQHPRVARATSAQLQQLEGIDVVIAPSLCESYPRELTGARARGVPTVATLPASGFARPTRRVASGDVDGLVAGIRDVLAGGGATIADVGQGARAGERMMPASLRDVISRV